jgi:hypothetical protein
MHVIPNKVDFYITNVCNLTCQNCNRFNNYKFSGWQRWSDYADVYQQWSKQVKLTAITIMGGEPFLNPTLPDWVEGLNKTFGISVQILTNGTRLRQAGDLYSKMQYVESNGAMNSIGVSVHIPEEHDQLCEDIRYFLQGTVTELGPEENPWGCQRFVDSNGVAINVYLKDEFGPSALRLNYRKQLTVYRSDPILAHQNCAFAKWKSYHFIKGKLYKCAPVALLPEFDSQHPLPLSPSERTVLDSYRPLTVENYNEYANQFWETIDNPIPQCQFCPVNGTMQKIFPVRKGATGD